MPFNFPDNPGVNAQVTNDTTGVTYQWDSTAQTWVVVHTSAIDDFVTDVELQAETSARESADGIHDVALENLAIESSGHEARITALEVKPDPEIPAQLTYQIGTDKVMLRAGDPSIELVDSEGFYSNVKFHGTGGVSVTSDLNSIIIDASGIDSGSDVNLDNYYTKAEIDEQFGYQGLGYYFLLANNQGYPTIRPGEWSTDNRLAGQVTMISIAPVDEHGANVREGLPGDIINVVNPATNTEYQYTVTVAGGNSYVVQYTDSAEKQNDVLGVGDPSYIYIYPTHISAADYYTKTQSNNIYLKKTEGTTQTLKANVKYSGLMTETQHLVHKGYVDSQIAGALATVQESDYATVAYVNGEVDKALVAFNTEDLEPDIFYGDYSPVGEMKNGNIWFDSMNLRMNVWSQGAWINPDRNDGKDLEDRITALEARIAQLEGN